MPKRCPACGGQAPDEARDCPNCPASFVDEEEERHGARRRRSHVPLPLRLLAAACVLAGGLVAAWRGLEFVMERAGGEDSFTMSKLSQGPIQRPAEPQAGAGGGPRDSSSAGYSLEREGEGQQGSVPEGPSAEAAPVTSWSLRGQVVDLVTLRPVSGARLTFLDPPTDRRLHTVTDRLGRYRVRLPPLHLRGYSVKVVKEGYAPDTLDPHLEGVRRMTRDERRRLSEELSRSLVGPYEILPDEEGRAVTDLYLAPLR